MNRLLKAASAAALAALAPTLAAAHESVIAHAHPHAEGVGGDVIALLVVLGGLAAVGLVATFGRK